MAELPRPGVEVIQEFESASPTIINPTLVPFVTGPAKEIVEFTDSDGVVNSSARQGSYDQLPQIISQSAFPSPRGNIQEVDVEEASIRVALLFGGQLGELDRDPGSAFLTSWNESRRAAVRTAEITGAGVDLDGLVLVLAIDQRARLNTASDVVVTFATVGGGNLSAEQVADQINSAVGAQVATVVPSGSNERVQIASRTWGAGSSVTIRAGGSANADLVGLTDSVEYRVEAAGFHAEDQANNTTLSPYIVWSQGVRLEDGVATSFVTAGASEAQIGQIHKDSNNVDVFAQAVAPNITFTGPSSIDLKVGDYFVADGVRPNSASEVSRVEANRFKLGVVNTALSSFDDSGNVLTPVYDPSNVNTLFAGVAFSPRYAWFRARNLVGESVNAQPASLTGLVGGSPATVASIVGSGAGGGPFALAGLTLVTQVTLDGVLQDEHVFTFTGGPYADMDAVVAAISIPNVIAVNDGGELRLSTTSTGAKQGLQLKSTSTALAALSISADSVTGTDVEFLDTPATIVSGAHTFAFTLGGASETLIIEFSNDGGSTWTAGTVTHTFSTDGPFANIGALVTELTSGTSWGGSGPTAAGIVVTSSGNALVIQSIATGSLVGIRVGAASTSIGPTANSDIQFTSGQFDVGEENIAGQIFKLRLNDRPQIYTVVFQTDSLDDAVDEINDTVGSSVASIGGMLEDRLILTSTLEGAASKIEVIDDGVNDKALTALGFVSGNDVASGQGRPSPDLMIDASGNVLVGAEVLRSAVTGVPFGNSSADLYLQYTALRLDVSPRAANAGLLSISDVDTLQQVLSPINSANPLGLAMFFQVINAPGIACKGMGVGEATAASPNGTAIAYAEVANFIESEEIYAIAPLTHDKLVHDLFRTHAVHMSSAEQKGERILIQVPSVPDRAVDTVIASGLSANTSATPNQLVVDVNPGQGLVNNGITDFLDISEGDNVFVELVIATPSGQEVRNYSVSTVVGTLVEFRTTFSSGFNQDGFYSVTPLTETLVNADWSMRIRGAELLIPGSTLPDKNKIAETVAAMNQSAKNRRVYSLFPDTIVASVGGIEEALPAYYAAAAITGQIAANPPQQGFTNFPIAGLTGVQGSNDTFSTRQLNIMAGGGTYILVQDSPGAAVISRHQLSTDLTSIETRELSITKVVDFVAKFLRTGLRNFIGTFNITQPFLDTLSTVIQGMLTFLEEGGVILGGDLNNLIQDKNQPDTVLVDVTLDVPYPCNYIRLTLVI
jgi:hypothetical protein